MNIREQPAKKLRVGIFTESYPPVVNGVTTSVITLIGQLQKLGHEVFVFSSEFPGYTGDPGYVYRVPAFFTPFDKAYPVPLPLTRRIIADVSAMELDIIHTQSPFLMGLIARHVARLHKIPLVATNHTIYTEYVHYVPFIPKILAKESAHVWIGWYYTGCDTVITPSNFSANRLRDEYGVEEARIAVIPSGIMLPGKVSEDAKQEVRKKYGIPEEAPVLMYAGRMAKEKNLWMLLKACEDVIFRERPDARLVLAGSGMLAAALQDAADKSDVLRGKVVLTGFLKREDLIPIYASATLLTFPSLTETQGMVVGEAMANGVPCVAVNEGGAPETVNDGVDGLRAPNDPKDFGAAVVRLLADPEKLAGMRKEALASSLYRTPECMGAKVIEVYNNVLAKRKGTA